MASWWWMNTHDDMCIAGQDIPDWLTKIQPPVSMSDEVPEITKKSQKNTKDKENLENIESDTNQSEKGSKNANLVESRIPKRRRLRGGRHR